MRFGTFDLEQRTREIGRDLFRRVHDTRVPFSVDHWLDGRFMRLSMRNEAVKAQLFRLVDALPSLTTPEQINSHLREYLATVAGQLPDTAQALLAHWPNDGLFGRMIAGLTRANIKRMAHGFVAAEDLEQAVAVIRSLRDRQLAFTIDVLGEAVVSEMETDRYQALYLQIIDRLADSLAHVPAVPLIDQDHTGPLPRVNVSLKLSALDSQFDPLAHVRTSRVVRERLRPILRLAQSRGVFINFDMEQSAFKNLTLQIFKEVLAEEEFRNWPDAGIALQAYLRETEADLADLLNWAEQRGTPVTVRLVKGAYWDYETVIAAQNDWPSPVFTQKSATDENFERLTTFLLEHHEQLRPAIASHNVRSIAHALAEAERLELPPRSLEFQLLFGMGDPIKTALVELEHRVRVYTPFGELLPGMAYLVRRLLENTSNTSFLRQGFIEHDPEDQLLMNPTLLVQPSATPALTGFHNEPVADFSRAASRAQMQTALDTVRGQLGQLHPLVIGGQKITSDAVIDSLNPSHRREIVGRCSRATVTQAVVTLRND